MTTTEVNRPEIEAPPEPGSIGAGSEIYRRMERHEQRRPPWMIAVPIVAVAVLAAGGVVAYEAMKPNTAPQPAPVQSTLPPVALAPIAPVASKPAQVAAAAPTQAPAPVARAARPEHAHPALAVVARKRTAHEANAAASASEDTSAYIPAPRPAVSAAPAQSAAPASEPAPVTVSPPPPASSAQPVNPATSSQTAPAPQP